jgi:hypothetical protein
VTESLQASRKSNARTGGPKKIVANFHEMPSKLPAILSPDR